MCVVVVVGGCIRVRIRIRTRTTTRARTMLLQRRPPIVGLVRGPPIPPANAVLAVSVLWAILTGLVVVVVAVFLP